MDYSVGSLFWFEVLKSARRLSSKPVVIGSFIRMLAFCTLYSKNTPRELPPDFVAYLQKEQRGRLFAFARKPWVSEFSQ